MSIWTDTPFAVAVNEIDTQLRTWVNAVDAGGAVPVYYWEAYADVLRTGLDPFVVLQFVAGNTLQKTVGAPGNNWWETDSSFVVHIFVPTGELFVLRAYGWADEISELFRATQLTGVTCYGPEPPISTVTNNGTWQALTMSIPYTHRKLA